MADERSESRYAESASKDSNDFFQWPRSVLFGSAKKTVPEGMKFEDRAKLIGSLLALKKRGTRSAKSWAWEVRAVLTRVPELKPLAEALPNLSEHAETGNADSADKSEKAVERQITEVVETALRLAEAHPVAAFGVETRHLITEAVEASVWSSGPERLIKWLIPTLIALIFGGIKIESLRDYANKTELSIGEAGRKAAEAAVNSTKVITDLEDRALSDWTKQLKEAAERQVNRFEQEIILAKNNAQQSIQDKAKEVVEATLPRFYNSQSKKVEEAAAEAGSRLGKRRDELLPQVEQVAMSSEGAISEARTRVEMRSKAFDERYAKLQEQLELDLQKVNRFATEFVAIEADAKGRIESNLSGLLETKLPAFYDVQSKSIADAAVAAVGELGKRRDQLLPQVDRTAMSSESAIVEARTRVEKSRPRKTGQDDRWNFCLTAGTLCPSNQEI